jgi:hypothetical protein
MEEIMKSKVVVLFVFIMILSLIPNAYALNNEAVEAADTLYKLGLFSGTGINSNGEPIYELDRAPTRHEAVTMLVRLLGKEQEALAGSWTIPFIDVASWAKPYVGYAYSNGLTSGTSATTFSGNDTISATQYITLVLRALGYKDSNGDFAWNAAWELSDMIGLTGGEYNSYTNSDFLRENVVSISHNALKCKIANSEVTLLTQLFNDSVVSLNVINQTSMNQYVEVFPNSQNSTSSPIGFVLIDGKLLQYVYSYELKEQRYMYDSHVIYLKEDTSEIFFNAYSDYRFDGINFLALLTNSYKTTTKENPYVDGAIDIFMTGYHSSTIKVSTSNHYISATETDTIYKHSYNGNSLELPSIGSNSYFNSNIIVNGIRYSNLGYQGVFVSLKDYCDYFGLSVDVKVEYDEKLAQNILVIKYK